MATLPHHLLKICDFDYLALILGKHGLSVLVLIYLQREEFQRQIHHYLSVEIPRVDHVIHIQTLA